MVRTVCSFLVVSALLCGQQTYQPDYLPGLEVSNLQTAAKGAKPATIVVIGTGISCSHTQLKELVDIERSRSFVDSTDNPCVDEASHESLVANIAATVAGRNVSVISFKVWRYVNGRLETTEDIIRRAFEAVAELEDDFIIVNASFAIPDWTSVRDAIIRLRGKALIVAAAGNAGNQAEWFLPTFPCAYGQSFGNVICVAAMTPDWSRLVGGSRRGGWVDIAARGDNMCGDGFSCQSGTSFAAPVVSGLAALLAQVSEPSLTPALAKGILIASGKTNNSLQGVIGNAVQANGMNGMSILRATLGEWTLKPIFTELPSGQLGAIAFAGNPIPFNGLELRGILSHGEQKREWKPAGIVGSNFFSLMVPEMEPGEYDLTLQIENVHAAPIMVRVE